ncbi:MAG: DUF4436 family protein [Methylovirgula sp.]|nr:DUF4436 family protein [Methylovirgula sp.]
MSDTETPERQISPVLSRAIVLAVLVTLCLIAYGVMLARFDMAKGPAEVELGAPSGEAQVRLYLQPTHIDPVNHAIQLRINLLPGSAAPDDTMIADRSYILRIRRGEQVEQIAVKAGQPLPEATFEFDLERGNVRDYPFDRYVSSTVLSASALTEDGTDHPLAIRAKAWEGLFGFTVEVQARPASHRDELALESSFSRTGAVAFFSLAIYGAMFVVAICALVIGSLVFVGTRKIEVPFVGALGAMIFALPVLRNALPGAPPLGVRADALIFFWAELGAIVGLCLFIVAWARRGAAP